MENEGAILEVRCTASLITISGRVQGVGFRPFVYRKAVGLGLTGWVLNDNEGVRIRVEGAPEAIGNFLKTLEESAPPASHITGVQVVEVPVGGFERFIIRPSENVSGLVTEISPDIAVCPDCLRDLEMQPHRLDYPLINCTNCGPRYTIIRDLPYDRPNTTMDVFRMCPDCSREYLDITDRRFHAQPVACNSCGPQYMILENGSEVVLPVQEIVERTARVIDAGGIVAVKGAGGFHLACNAFDEKAVKALRHRKGRDTKPLAVLFAGEADASLYARVSEDESAALNSWQRPVVLLQTRPSGFLPLASGLNPGLSTIGALLPYLPFHYLLFRRLNTKAIVFTSGNLSGEPIVHDEVTASRRLAPIADLLVSHQREIWNRIDDSVVRVMGGVPRVLRRARGFCPEPVEMHLPVDGILALGAEMVNTFCIGKSRQSFPGPYIGDLKDPEVQEVYRETIDRFCRLLRVKPDLVVTDLHPLYFSTREGERLFSLWQQAGRQVGIERVQHHHAHIASCMAEHQLEGPVIGVAFDGTGLGTDGHTWGSEFLVADLTGFYRVSHLEYLPMPGGDQAVKEPWRMAVACLHLAFGERVADLDLPLLHEAGRREVDWIIRMITRRLNTPLTCGAGRYFDAVAALMGLCVRAGYEGEGPMKLEALTVSGLQEAYPVETGEVISFREGFRAIAGDLKQGLAKEIVATKFHNSMISAIFDTANQIRRQTELQNVCLSGGVFQNRYILENTERKLRDAGFTVYSQAAIPSNDGGISLGQLAVAAKRKEKHVLGRSGQGGLYNR